MGNLVLAVAVAAALWGIYLAVHNYGLYHRILTAKEQRNVLLRTWRNRVSYHRTMARQYAYDRYDVDEAKTKAREAAAIRSDKILEEVKAVSIYTHAEALRQGEDAWKTVYPTEAFEEDESNL